jgi:hypothetical protein
MASGQALYAMAALLRFQNHRRALFDFRAEPDMPSDGTGTIIDVVTGADLKPQLEQIYVEIAEVKAEIDAINTEILGSYYPFDRIGLGERAELKRFIGRIERLSVKDREGVSGYAELLAAEKRLDTLYVVRICVIAALVVIAAGLWVLLYRRKKRKNEESGVREE